MRPLVNLQISPAGEKMCWLEDDPICAFWPATKRRPGLPAWCMKSEHESLQSAAFPADSGKGVKIKWKPPPPFILIDMYKHSISLFFNPPTRTACRAFHCLFLCQTWPICAEIKGELIFQSCYWLCAFGALNAGPPWGWCCPYLTTVWLHTLTMMRTLSNDYVQVHLMCVTLVPLTVSKPSLLHTSRTILITPQISLHS